MIFLASTVAEMKATPAVPALTAIVFGEPYDLPPAVAALSPEALRARAGRYRAPSGAEVAVRAVEGGLEVDGLEPGRLRPPRRGARGRARAVRAPGRAHRRHRGAGLQGRPDRHPRGPRRAPGPRADPPAGGRADARPRGAARRRTAASPLVGASPYGEGRVETAVRVDFERGSVYNRFLWGPGDGLVGLQAGPEPPGARYVPVSERELVAFRLGGGGGPQRRVSFEGEGGAAVLVVPGADGPVRLPARALTLSPVVRKTVIEKRRQSATGSQCRRIPRDSCIRVPGCSALAVRRSRDRAKVVPHDATTRPRPTGSSSTTASRRATPRPGRTSTPRCSPGCGRSCGPRRAFRRALDVGCGTGLSSVALLDLAGEVVGIDAALAMLRHASRAQGVRYVASGAEALPFRERLVRPRGRLRLDGLGGPARASCRGRRSSSRAAAGSSPSTSATRVARPTSPASRAGTTRSSWGVPAAARERPDDHGGRGRRATASRRPSTATSPRPARSPRRSTRPS